MKRSFWTSAETLFALACLALGILGFAFLGSLVAEPKVLFGRSLTAISPSLFPSIVLVALSILCIIHVASQLRLSSGDVRGNGITGWRRGAVFFGTMTVYALLMVPIGFIISSAVTIFVLSWFIGNRSVVQMGLIAVFAPILLYLAATRLLAVSLPELDAIQLAIARVLG